MLIFVGMLYFDVCSRFTDAATDFFISCGFCLISFYDNIINPLICRYVNYKCEDIIILGNTVFIKKYIGNAIFYVDSSSGVEEFIPNIRFLSFEVSAKDKKYEIIDILNMFMIVGNIISDDHILDIMKKYCDIDKTITADDLSYKYISGFFDFEKSDTILIKV